MRRDLSKEPLEIQNIMNEPYKPYWPKTSEGEGSYFITMKEMFRDGFNVPKEELDDHFTFDRGPGYVSIPTDLTELAENADKNSRLIENVQDITFDDVANEVELIAAAIKGYTFNIPIDKDNTYEAKLELENLQPDINNNFQSRTMSILARPQGIAQDFEKIPTDYIESRQHFTEYKQPGDNSANGIDRIVELVQEFGKEKIAEAQKNTESTFPSLDELKTRAQNMPHRDVENVASTSEAAASLNTEPTASKNDSEFE